MWQAILEALFQALKFFYNFTKDWGIAIILLTIVFRILVWPLMTKQVKSSIGMQKLQPLMKEIQEKYADDKQKQQEELMKLYKEQEVSPFAGCLPMLLQFPLLFAFYGMLTIAHADKTGKLIGGGPLYHYLGGKAAPFLFGFLPDIMKTPDMILKAHGGWNNFFGALPSLWPYLLIVVIFAVGGMIPMLMMPGGAQQKSMGVFMSLFMVYIGFIVPAGAGIYYSASTLFAAGQQALIQTRMKEAEEKAAQEIIVEKGKKKGKKNKSKNA